MDSIFLHCTAANAAWVSVGTDFLARYQILYKVIAFKYLGKILSYDNSEHPTVYSKLHRVQRKWGRLSRMLVHEGADTRTSGKFYVALVQLVLLLISETWVVMPFVLRVLVRLHHWVERNISGQMHW